ncbi:MAG: hypothetical protein QXL01_01295 [Thermoplasmatales archaeon]
MNIYNLPYLRQYLYLWGLGEFVFWHAPLLILTKKRRLLAICFAAFFWLEPYVNACSVKNLIWVEKITQKSFIYSAENSAWERYVALRRFALQCRNFGLAIASLPKYLRYSIDLKIFEKASEGLFLCYGNQKVYYLVGQQYEKSFEIFYSWNNVGEGDSHKSINQTEQYKNS